MSAGHPQVSEPLAAQVSAYPEKALQRMECAELRMPLWGPLPGHPLALWSHMHVGPTSDLLQRLPKSMNAAEQWLEGASVGHVQSVCAASVCRLCLTL